MPLGGAVNDPGFIDFLKIVLTVTGGIAAAFITARLSRKSQAESNRVEEANSIVERYNKLTADLVLQKDTAVEENQFLRKQVSLWRRYAHNLRAQIYGLHGVPVEADENLEL